MPFDLLTGNCRSSSSIDQSAATPSFLGSTPATSVRCSPAVASGRVAARRRISPATARLLRPRLHAPLCIFLKRIRPPATRVCLRSSSSVRRRRRSSMPEFASPWTPFLSPSPSPSPSLSLPLRRVPLTTLTRCSWFAASIRLQRFRCSSPVVVRLHRRSFSPASFVQA